MAKPWGVQAQGPADWTLGEWLGKTAGPGKGPSILVLTSRTTTSSDSHILTPEAEHLMLHGQRELSMRGIPVPTG